MSIYIQDGQNRQMSLVRPRSGVLLLRGGGGHERVGLQQGQHSPSLEHYHTLGIAQQDVHGTSSVVLANRTIEWCHNFKGIPSARWCCESQRGSRYNQHTARHQRT
jgi:hypothetical protein